MAKYQKDWFNWGYADNHKGEHPYAVCQTAWMDFIDGLDDMTFLVNHFPFYKKGTIKAFNEKNNGEYIQQA